MARCPAHQDRNPSLSIHEGERGLLVKCWAGCGLEDICGTLGIRQSDLFFDALTTDPHQRRESAKRRAAERAQRETHQHAQGTVIDALREADYFIHSRRGLDISNWNNARLETELNALADAYALLESEVVRG